jgi:hypothetical protein
MTHVETSETMKLWDASPLQKDISQQTTARFRAKPILSSDSSPRYCFVAVRPGMTVDMCVLSRSARCERASGL